MGLLVDDISPWRGVEDLRPAGRALTFFGRINLHVFIGRRQLRPRRLMLETLGIDSDIIGRFVHGLHLLVAVIGPIILIFPFVAFEETAAHY